MKWIIAGYLSIILLLVLFIYTMFYFIASPSTGSLMMVIMSVPSEIAGLIVITLLIDDRKRLVNNHQP